MARAAAAAGTIFCQSTLSSVRPAEVAAAAPGGARWFQLYLSKDREFAKALLDEVADSGYSAVVLTVDLPRAAVASATCGRLPDPGPSFRCPASR